MDNELTEENVGREVVTRFYAGELYIPLPSLTWLEFTGNDRNKVLGNLTTNNVLKLESGQGCESFITDVRGKTFGHGCFYAIDQTLCLLTVENQAERLLTHIDRYVIREDIQMADRSSDWFTVFWRGNGSSAFAKVLDQLGFDLQGSSQPKLATVSIETNDLQIRAFQVPWTRDGDWLLRVDRKDAESLESLFVSYDILPGHERLLHGARVVNRYPWFGVDFDETNLPQELDRDARTIDFRKGCYLGQETIARLDAMGQVQKKLMLWKFAGDQLPQPGTELKQGEKLVGKVSSATYDFQQEASLALVMTRRSHFAEDSTAETDLGIAVVERGERIKKG